MDVFDRFVTSGQSVCLGEAVTRKYTVKYIALNTLLVLHITLITCKSIDLYFLNFQPVIQDNSHIVLYIFSSDQEEPRFITDSNVELCGSLRYLLARREKYKEIKISI